MLLGAFVLALAACGGGDDDSDDSDGADQDEQAGGTATTADGDAGTDTTGDGGDEPADPSAPPTIDVSGLEGFCREAIEARNAIIGLEGPDADAADAPGLYAAAYEILAAVEPPQALAEDWTAITDLIATAAEALEDIDVTDQEAVDEAFADADLEQAHGHALQRLGNRADLGQHVDAVGVLVDHALQAANLALDAPEALAVVVLVHRVTAHAASQARCTRHHTGRG